jgi:hypothetical protein
VLIPVQIAAETLIEQIGWRGAGLPVIIFIVIFFCTAFFLLLIFHFRRVHRDEANSRELAEELFMENVQRCELTQRETAKVRTLLMHASNVQPHIVFQSITVFEKCIDEEVRRLNKSGFSVERLHDEDTLLSTIRSKLGFSFLHDEHPLISSRNIAIGQNGSLFGKDNKIPLIGTARVIERTEWYLRIGYNGEKENMYHISPGTILKFVFTRKHDGLYGIPLTVNRADPSGTVEFFHSLDIRRNQLRQYVRVEVSIPVKVRLIKVKESETSEVQRGETIDGRIADISGGGVSFTCKKSLRPGDIVSLQFSVSGQRIVGLAAKLLRITLQEGRVDTFFRHHVTFFNVEPSLQEKIVKYIFEKQRQLNQWR